MLHLHSNDLQSLNKIDDLTVDLYSFGVPDKKNIILQLHYLLPWQLVWTKRHHSVFMTLTYKFIYIPFPPLTQTAKLI